MLKKLDLVTTVAVLHLLTYAAHLSISACNAIHSREDLIPVLLRNGHQHSHSLSFPGATGDNVL